MRDGIYKSLKLGQGWKSLLKSCEREKERGDMASGKARNAVAKDLYIEVSAVFVHEMLSQCATKPISCPGLGQSILNSLAAIWAATTRHLRMMCLQAQRDLKQEAFGAEP